MKAEPPIRDCCLGLSMSAADFAAALDMADRPSRTRLRNPTPWQVRNEAEPFALGEFVPLEDRFHLQDVAFEETAPS